MVFLCPLLMASTATKTGNRLEMKECLELAAQGRIKTQYALRRMESLSEVSSLS